jgi:hypothetical protein
VNIFLWPFLAVVLERWLYDARLPSQGPFWKFWGRPILTTDVILPDNVAISVRNLRKVYRTSKWPWSKGRVQAIDNLSFDIPKSGIFGLLGSNGCASLPAPFPKSMLMSPELESPPLWPSWGDCKRHPRVRWSFKVAPFVLPAALSRSFPRRMFYFLSCHAFRRFKYGKPSSGPLPLILMKTYKVCSRHVVLARRLTPTLVL